MPGSAFEGDQFFDYCWTLIIAFDDDAAVIREIRKAVAQDNHFKYPCSEQLIESEMSHPGWKGVKIINVR